MPPRLRARPSRSPSPAVGHSLGRRRAETPATAATAAVLRRQLYLILALRCLRTASFAQPVLVVWFADVGLSPAGVLWLGSFYSALVILAEVPSGLISDRLGRRRTLHWAFLALAASLGVAALADRALWLLGASQLLKAVGSALFSGTDMALLYETLKRYKAASEVKEQVLTVESMHIFAVAVTEALFATLGGVLASSFGLQVTVALSAAPFLGSALLALLLEDDLQPRPSQSSAAAGASARRKDQAAATSSAAAWLPPPGLGWVFAGGVAVNCGTYVAATALNPLLWAAAAIPTLHFGWISACNNVVSAGSALLAPPVRRLVSAGRGSVAGSEGDGGGRVVTERLLLLLLGASSCAYAFLAASSTSAPLPRLAAAALGLQEEAAAAGLAVGGGLLLSVVRGLAWPLLGAAINSAVEDDSRRATTLSLFAGMIKVGMVCTSALLGALLGGGSGKPSADADADTAVSSAVVEARGQQEVEGAVGADGLYTACAACGLLLAALAGCGGLAMGVGGGNRSGGGASGREHKPRAESQAAMM